MPTSLHPQAKFDPIPPDLDLHSMGFEGHPPLPRSATTARKSLKTRLSSRHPRREAVGHREMERPTPQVALQRKLARGALQQEA